MCRDVSVICTFLVAVVSWLSSCLHLLFCHDSPPSSRPRRWLVSVANMIPPLVPSPSSHVWRSSCWPGSALRALVLFLLCLRLPLALSIRNRRCFLSSLPSSFSLFFLASRPSLSLALALALALARPSLSPFLPSSASISSLPRFEPLSSFFCLLASRVGPYPLSSPPLHPLVVVGRTGSPWSSLALPCSRS